MSSLFMNHKHARKNYIYWKIQKILPTTSKRERIYFFKFHNARWQCVSRFNYFFKFHNARWQCVSRFNYYSGWLMIRFYYRGPGTVDQFKVRAGIVEESGKEIISFDANVIPGFAFIEFENFIHRSQIGSILKAKNVLNFFLEIKRKGEGTVLVPKVQMDFKELLLTGENSDVTILVNCRKFNCHSIILGARSPVLKAMMKHEMEGKRCAEITITDSEPTVFEEFLLYLYTGSKEHLNMDNSAELFKLGDKYFIEDLKNLCVKHMMRNISTENFFDIFLLSQQHNDIKLCKAAIQFLLKHSNKLVNSRKWKDFLWKYPDHSDVLIETLDDVVTMEQLEQNAPGARVTRAQNFKAKNKKL